MTCPHRGKQKGCRKQTRDELHVLPWFEQTDVIALRDARSANCLASVRGFLLTQAIDRRPGSARCCPVPSACVLFPCADRRLQVEGLNGYQSLRHQSGSAWDAASNGASAENRSRIRRAAMARMRSQP